MKTITHTPPPLYPAREGREGVEAFDKNESHSLKMHFMSF